jgi:hypothetical protein
VRLHVLTAVSRPENLQAVEASLDVAADNAPGVRMTWHWRLDVERQHVGGQAIKNQMLDEIKDGWVWVLDDDTTAHPDVLAAVEGVMGARPEAVIVSQQRTDGRVLLAQPSWMVPGGVDIGQAFLRRDLIGDHRIPESYEGDGEFIQAVLAGARALYVPEVLSLHNALSGVDVSV